MPLPILTPYRKPPRPLLRSVKLALGLLLLIQGGFFIVDPTTAKGPYVTAFDAVAIGTGYAPAHVGSNAALKSYTSNFIQALVASASNTPTIVERDSPFPGGTGPMVRYAYAASPCAAPDDGAQVAAASGGCWIADLPAVPDVRVWPVRCDRTTDDVAALNAAFAALSSIGGGDIRMCRTGALVDSADLVIPPNVNLVGGFAIGTVRQGGNYTSSVTTPYAIVLNPARTIRQGAHTTVHGVPILRKGLVAATDYHSGLASLAAFGGTAITYTDASGNAVEGQTSTDLLILGFNLAINAGASSRFTIDHLKCDDNNSIATNGVYDVAYIDHVECWPFAITGSWSNPSRPIKGMSNNGNGLIRIAVPLISSANPATDSPPQVGEPIWVSGSNGVPGANTMWIVAAVSSDANYTYIDLKSSTFSGAWTSGGNLVSWTGRRPGQVLNVDNTSGLNINNTFGYGYQKAYYFGPGASGVKCGDCSFDDLSALNDPTTIGIDFHGERGFFSFSYMSSVGQKFIYAPSNTSDTSVIANSPVISPNNGRTITVNAGHLEILSSNVGGEIHMGSGSGSLTLVGVNQGSGFNITGDSAADLAKVNYVGDRSGSTFTKPASPFGSLPLSGTTTLGATSLNQVIYLTGAPWTLTLPDSNLAPAGALLVLVNNSSRGIISLAAQNNNGLDGDASPGIPTGGRLVLYADGYGNWRTFANSAEAFLSLSAAPASGDIPSGKCRMVYNTGDNTTKNYCNINGNLRASAALQ